MFKYKKKNKNNYEKYYLFMKLKTKNTAQRYFF